MHGSLGILSVDPVSQVGSNDFHEFKSHGNECLLSIGFLLSKLMVTNVKFNETELYNKQEDDWNEIHFLFITTK